MEQNESAYKPGFVENNHLSGMPVTKHLKRPTRIHAWAMHCRERHGSLFGLAPSGVYPATTVTSSAVRSYRTISPLPKQQALPWRYIFCGTFRRLTPPRRYLALCPMEPGLSSAIAAIVQLTQPLLYHI